MSRTRRGFADLSTGLVHDAACGNPGAPAVLRPDQRPEAFACAVRAFLDSVASAAGVSSGS